MDMKAYFHVPGGSEQTHGSVLVFVRMGLDGMDRSLEVLGHDDDGSFLSTAIMLSTHGTNG